jgi:hypothetical protein
MGVPIGLILAGVQAGVGIAKAVKAKKAEKAARNWRPSAEDRNALALSQREYADKSLPGQSAIEDGISLASANALQASRETGQLSESIATINANQNTAQRNLGIAAAGDQKSDLFNYQNALGAMGDLRDEQFNNNVFAPYAQNYQEGRQMVGASITNASNAIQEQKILDLYEKEQYNTNQLGSTAINAPQSSFSPEPIDLLNKKYGNVGLSADTRGYGTGNKVGISSIVLQSLLNK